ncbi:Intradiol ring-cleavage dioxygenase [Aspergillus caelatus]|uniref:Intradiol ring-cleavage dioxygenase n=1 Tax=Aspergillus caelatus TaxID=61420 RepID=A0A5N7A0S2_9EURO|nr:Intradiol ring-cleavage dioxygenase [Aspergillus caelatus]KAE8363461.1 Intradiol ring-cleavage dioxygenase [Aspergillus caelatus]
MINFKWFFVISLALHGTLTLAHSNTLTSRSLGHCNFKILTSTFLFSPYDEICVLDKEATSGPYYVSGEHIRQNISETQLGISLYLELQLIDVNTCQPVQNAFLDLPASGNADDTANVNTTFFREIQKTDAFGVARFETKFPGHYALRATHIHVIVHENPHVLPNGTLGHRTGSIAHVGQVFFDQTLIDLADTIYPHTQNTNVMVTNQEDGDSLEDGLVAWMAFGINTTSDYTDTVQETSFYGDEGGETNENYYITKLGPLETVPSGVPTPSAFTTTIGL